MTVRVLVTGAASSGRFLVAQMIRDVLKNAGVDLVVTSDCDEGAMHLPRPAGAAKGLKAKLEIKQTKRSA